MNRPAIMVKRIHSRGAIPPLGGGGGGARRGTREEGGGEQGPGGTPLNLPCRQGIEPRGELGWGG